MEFNSYRDEFHEVCHPVCSNRVMSSLKLPVSELTLSLLPGSPRTSLCENSATSIPQGQLTQTPQPNQGLVLVVKSEGSSETGNIDSHSPFKLEV
jgi:hypothetical protein